MDNVKHYPTHHGAEHPPITTCEIPLEEYESLKRENKRLKKCEIWMKQHFYCEEVIACESAKNRILKRALWLARAERADDRARIFYFNDLETMLDIDGFSYDRKKKKGCKKLTARHWRIIWLKVESKCRAKAEEYK